MYDNLRDPLDHLPAGADQGLPVGLVLLLRIVPHILLHIRLRVPRRYFGLQVLRGPGGDHVRARRLPQFSAGAAGEVGERRLSPAAQWSSVHALLPAWSLAVAQHSFRADDRGDSLLQLQGLDQPRRTESFPTATTIVSFEATWTTILLISADGQSKEESSAPTANLFLESQELRRYSRRSGGGGTVRTAGLISFLL